MSAAPIKRYSIVAWGSTEHPDLIEETDVVPADLNWKYPFVTVARNDALYLGDFKARTIAP